MPEPLRSAPAASRAWTHDAPARRRTGSLVLREESWGGLALDERHDRVWGFASDYYDVLMRAVEAGHALPPADADPEFARFLDEYGPWAGGLANPYRVMTRYFFGATPDEPDFEMQAPVSVSWAINSECQSACLYCCTDSHPRAHPGLGTDEVLRIVDSLAEWNALRLIIGGGEPTLRRDLEQVLRHTSAQGIRPTLATNALSLDRCDLALLRDTLMLAQVSLDSLDREVYRRVRGFRGDGVDTVLRGISALRDARVPVRVVTVLSRSNETELEQIAEYLASMDVQQWFIFLVQPAGRARVRFERFQPSAPERVRDRLAGVMERHQDLSVSYWGADDVDRVAVYVDSHGQLQLYDYGTGTGEQLERVSECSQADLRAAWRRISCAAQRATLMNFTSSARRPSAVPQVHA